MKKIIQLLSIVLSLIFLNSCVEHRYYRTHRDHSERYYRHHRRAEVDVNVHPRY